MQRLAKQWLEYAQRDRQAAKELFGHDDLPAIAASHCQQAIEKALKALSIGTD